MGWPAIYMRTATGSQTASLRCARGRWTFSVQADDVLDAGYDEASMALDEQSVKRLIAWLQTGVAPHRDDELPDLPEWTQRTEPMPTEKPRLT